MRRGTQKEYGSSLRNFQAKFGKFQKNKSSQRNSFVVLINGAVIIRPSFIEIFFGNRLILIRKLLAGRHVMRSARYSHPPLRDLGADGFNETRQGVMMSGFTWDCEVSVIVDAAAIKTAFPKNHSTQQCVSFVERNLDAFRGLVNSKLISGNLEDYHDRRGRGGFLVEIDFTDLERSRRWLTP